MKFAGDENVFLVSGFVGVNRSKDSQFLGYCVASDRASALRLMAKTIDGLNPLGVTSLAEMRAQVNALSKVLDGSVAAPIESGMFVRRN